MPGAADGPAGISLCQWHHAVRTPQLGALAEVLAQGRKHTHLEKGRNESERYLEGKVRDFNSSQHLVSFLESLLNNRFYQVHTLTG